VGLWGGRQVVDQVPVCGNLCPWGTKTGSPESGQWPGRPAGWWAGHSGVGVADLLSIQCIMVWRSFHSLGVQDANISALPVVLPQPILSAESQQGP
jgi:hypothetical protein